MTTQENYNRWLNSNKIDAQTKEVLLKMSKEEIDDAFFKDVVSLLQWTFPTQELN